MSKIQFKIPNLFGAESHPHDIFNIVEISLDAVKAVVSARIEEIKAFGWTFHGADEVHDSAYFRNSAGVEIKAPDLNNGIIKGCKITDASAAFAGSYTGGASASAATTTTCIVYFYPEDSTHAAGDIETLGDAAGASYLHAHG